MELQWIYNEFTTVPVVIAMNLQWIYNIVMCSCNGCALDLQQYHL